MLKLITIVILSLTALNACMGTSVSDDDSSKVSAVQQSQKQQGKEWPATVDAAVNDIIASLSSEDKEALRKTARQDLIQFHMGWGTGIRNAYGLLNGNDELREDACGKGCHPDDASMVIIERVWLVLQER